MDKVFYRAVPGNTGVRKSERERGNPESPFSPQLSGTFRRSIA